MSFYEPDRRSIITGGRKSTRSLQELASLRQPFAGGLCGLGLRRTLPAKTTAGVFRDMTGAVAGLVTLLTALVLGLLI